MLCRTFVMVIMLMMVSPVTFASAFRMGDQGSEVMEIQRYLARLGYDVIADGDFGPATADAVKTFQRSQGIVPDGLVGTTTYAALTGRTMMPAVSRGSNLINRRIINTAMQYIGVPYVFGGNSPSTGLDCSAYVKLVFSQVGISLPRTADYQFEVGTPIPRTELIPGDVVFFTTYTYGASHVGIYLGDGNFIHASSSRGVTISSLGSGYYNSRYIGARRMI